jgi:dipeptidase E
MAKHLVLASDLSGLLPKLKEALGGRKGRMLHVPTAATGEGWLPDPADLAKLADEGFEIVPLELADVADRLPDDALDGFDAVYVGGGNTFFLLRHMKRTGFFDLVKTEVANGMLYVGSSAGSVVATPDIGYADMIDDRTLGDGDDVGLSFVGFSILPHLDHESMGEGVRAQFDGWNGGQVFALEDGQAIVIDGQKIRVL